jgi:hypothetical protein
VKPSFVQISMLANERSFAPVDAVTVSVTVSPNIAEPGGPSGTSGAAPAATSETCVSDSSRMIIGARFPFSAISSSPKLDGAPT